MSEVGVYAADAAPLSPAEAEAAHPPRSADATAGAHASTPHPAKRFRPAPPPFHRVLRAQGGQKMRVKLTPAAETDTCPLTMGPAAEDELEFLPGVTYLQGLPHIRLMTLPCRHSFGAMSLLYHFARQAMRCPCCRSGVDARIASQSIPQHFRAALLRRVESGEMQDLRVQMEEDADAARALMQTDHGAVSVIFIDVPETISVSWLTLLAATHHVDMSVYAHLTDEDPPHINMNFQLVSHQHLLPDSNNPVPLDREIGFEMPFGDHRRLAMQLEALAVPRISVAVHARSNANRVVTLAHTPPVPVRSPQGALDAPRTIQAGTSRFTLHPRSGSDTLSHITWVAQAQTFEPLFEYYYA